MMHYQPLMMFLYGLFCSLYHHDVPVFWFSWRSCFTSCPFLMLCLISHVVMTFLLVFLSLYNTHGGSLYFHDLPVRISLPNILIISLYALPFLIFLRSPFCKSPSFLPNIPIHSEFSTSFPVSSCCELRGDPPFFFFSRDFGNGVACLLSASPPASSLYTSHYSSSLLALSLHTLTAACVNLPPCSSIPPSLPLKLGPRHLFFCTSRLSPLVWGRVAS